MRQGMDARLVFTNAGNLLAIVTGSDACAEHEGGSNRLMQQLTRQSVDEAVTLQQLRAGGPVRNPSLLDSKRITRFPTELQFVEVAGAVPEAILGLARERLSPGHPELRLCGEGLEDFPDGNVAGAWDEASFGFRVRGKRYVRALKGFYDAIKAGRGVFAGTFLRPNHHMAGVILANEAFFGDQERNSIRQAQLSRESQFRLKAREDVRKLLQELESIDHRHVYRLGHFWAQWADDAESGVEFCLNPGYGVKADYHGPYTREQIIEWARAGCSYQLRRFPLVQTSTVEQEAAAH